MLNEAASADNKILVIDDDTELREALTRSLSLRGFKVFEAADSESALLCAEANRPGRVVLDLVIGIEKGIDLINPLKELLPEAKVVVLTGYGTVRTAVQAMQLGADNYLSKPVEVDELLLAFEATEAAKETGASSSFPTLDEVEREHLQKVLYEYQGNITQAAKALRMHRRSLQRKLQKLA